MDVNPYASPTVPNEPETPGVGAWRDGPYLVMHLTAELPRYCIATGDPADGAREFVLTWKNREEWLSRTHLFWLPQTRVYLNQYSRQKRRGQLGVVLLGLASILSVVSVSPSLQFIPALSLDEVRSWLLFVALGLVVAGGFLWLASAVNRPPLKQVHSWRDYIWFQGAHPEFLARLQPWPLPSR
ncbi:hypothetical protein ETAA8_05680 [Anatilimnocola aggregata]|uniref:Uncharacterized protein n=1 Tax=Anatilimnocola aggregata TaxID=2528021 RepID=A0A517Y5I4_9BACT|nr:hypothetical protein [Anatilimnocola aggregata]QDU25499.1 hypothetical protein ETAA8_05680 [Anatilimnocola aggregata]